MNFYCFISLLQKFAPLGIEEQEALKTRVNELQISKGTIVLYQEEVCKSIYFIVDGFFRIYTVDGELETTVNFASKGEILTAFSSFIHQQKSKEAIVCERDSTVIRINYYDLLALQDLHIEFMKIQFLFLQEYFLKTYQEIQDLRSANTFQKYLYLCSKYPGIANLTSYKNIASYLGVAPPTLSNILKEKF